MRPVQGEAAASCYGLVERHGLACREGNIPPLMLEALGTPPHGLSLDYSLIETPLTLLTMRSTSVTIESIEE
jgi:hypothetical protein